MRKRVGITHDERERRTYWQKQCNVRNWQVVRQGLTYEQAQSVENEYIDRGYEGSPGGEKKYGPVYYVYIFEY